MKSSYRANPPRPQRPKPHLSGLQKILMQAQVGEWVYDERSAQAKAAAKATGVRVVEYGLAHPDVHAQWEVWVTFMIDGEERTALARSPWFPDFALISGLLMKVSVAGALGDHGISPEGKDEAFEILGKL